MKMASSSENNKTGSSHHLVDDFESAFQNCISLLTSQEHFNVQDSEETKGGVENSVHRFLESARQMEAFFLNKRLVLSVAKPENVLSEDMMELKAEHDRKEALLEKHHDKLAKWQNLMRSNTTLPPSSTSTSQSSPYAGNQGGGNMPVHQSMAPTSVPSIPNSGPPYMGGGPGGGGPPMQPQQMMNQPQQQPGMTPGQYPGPPAGHPGQYMPPPAYPQQGPLAFLERM